MSEIINGLKEIFFGKKPDEMQTEAKKPEPEKVEAPSEPTPTEPATLKTFPTGSPKSRTKGIEQIKERY